ncbi:MarR family winged helix-turn-helix transcriptional regulator [Methyloradius palustris]|uniref:HTH marR-type domain-containing protein n=1 Tax=Methyloradius palustris TaxID=2778876 RepID=A0A8D5G2I1_9PROT|nr:MarR family transcriptional regulator [Methyloradius palustris]BCM24480.1 hypothetical protein ZMTM_07390 [Methyloradius palustris]
MKSSSNSNISSLESHLGFWLRFVSNHVSTQFSIQIEKEGVSISEWVALRHLFQSTESSTAELISALGMTKGAASKVVSRLEEKLYVKRVSNQVDKREQLLTLTSAGKAIVPRLATLADQNDAAFFECLSQSKRDALMGLLKEIATVHQLKKLPVD